MDDGNALRLRSCCRTMQALDRLLVVGWSLQLLLQVGRDSRARRCPGSSVLCRSRIVFSHGKIETNFFPISQRLPEQHSQSDRGAIFRSVFGITANRNASPSLRYNINICAVSKRLSIFSVPAKSKCTERI